VPKTAPPARSAPVRADSSVIPKLERVCFTLVLLLLLAAHLQFLFKIGPLWRDEINTVEMASLPRVADIWNNLQYDSFPVIWFLVLRVWMNLGLTSDFALRVLGCLVGLGMVAMLWATSRRMKFSFPFFSLAVFALNPMVIRYGDSQRAYGFGILLFLVTLVCVWEVMERPKPLSIGLAALAALVSVHTLFQNAVFLFVILMAGVAVTWQRKNLRLGFTLLAIGGLAAVSMLPYLRVIKQASEWNMVVQAPEFNFAWFMTKLSEATTPQLIWVWGALTAIAFLAGIYFLLRPGLVDGKQRELVLFGVVVLALGVAGFYCFLKTLHYFTQPWYYVGFLALVAVAIDALLAAVERFPSWRVVRLVTGISLAAVGSVSCWNQLPVRHTNVDQIAARLEQLAGKDDFIVVNLWYNGITFQRYFKGQTPWMTLPPVGVPKIHRYDLIKAKMEKPSEALAPLPQKIAETLQAGHRVWLVGGLSFLEPGQLPPQLPPAPDPQLGWLDGSYNEGWSMQLGYFVQTHATNLDRIDFPPMPPINQFERIGLLVVSGWQSK
jgi:hypothetical protein